MIHTIINLADVFADTTAERIVVERYRSGKAEYIRFNGQKRLHRLYSTDPADYLNIY